MPSLRNTVDNKVTVSFHKPTKSTLHLDDGSWHSTDVLMSLTLIELLDVHPLDSFGVLSTNNGRICLPSWRNIVKRTEIASFPAVTKRILCLEGGSQRSEVDGQTWFWTNIQTRVDWIRLDSFWPTIGEMLAKLEEYCRQHWDCLVPRFYRKDPSLAIWVMAQRKQRDKLNPTRRKG